MEVTYHVFTSEQARFSVKFDSLEELKAAVVIITLHNLSSLYNVIARDAEECYRVSSFTVDGPTVTAPLLTFKGFVTSVASEQLGFLEEKLRRSYESVQ